LSGETIKYTTCPDFPLAITEKMAYNNTMKILTNALSLNELRQMAKAGFGDMVKAVVDVEKALLAVDAELHSDLEALLLDSGSKQKDLWGINFYPDLPEGDFIEFDSMINVRPSQGNRSRNVENEELREKIIEICGRKIKA